MIVIRFIELAGAAELVDPSVKPGDYLKTYDPEAHDGQGFVEWTRNPDDAMKFITTGAALELVRYQPKNRPYRADGKPNRPITAFTISIEML